MKKAFLAKASLGLAVLLTATGVFAQDSSKIKTLPPITITATHKKVPEKVWNSFRKYFENAIDAKWYEFNKNYLVHYMTDENPNRALFTKRGTLIYNISYGYENQLPVEVRDQVKGSYFDYAITKAIKVTEGDRLVWVVNVESDKTIIILVVENGEMGEYQKFDKA